MSVEHFFQKSIIIRRLSTVSGGKKNFVATGTVDGYIRQTSDLPVNAGSYGVKEISHKAYVDINANIQRGDKITDSDGNVYNVEGVNEKGRGIAMNEHLEAYLSLISQ